MWFPVAAPSKEAVEVGLVGVAQVSFFDSQAKFSSSFKLASGGKFIPLGSVLPGNPAHLGLVTGVIKLESLASGEAGQVFKVFLHGDEVQPMISFKAGTAVYLPTLGATCLFLANFQNEPSKIKVNYFDSDRPLLSLNFVLNKGVCLIPLDEIAAQSFIDPDFFVEITSSCNLLASLLYFPFLK